MDRDDEKAPLGIVLGCFRSGEGAPISDLSETQPGMSCAVRTRELESKGITAALRGKEKTEGPWLSDTALSLWC